MGNQVFSEKDVLGRRVFTVNGSDGDRLYDIALHSVRVVLRASIRGDRRTVFARHGKNADGKAIKSVSPTAYNYAWELYNNARMRTAYMERYSADVQDLIQVGVTAVYMATADGVTDYGDLLYAGVCAIGKYIRAEKSPRIDYKNIFLEEYIAVTVGVTDDDDRPTTDGDDTPTADGVYADDDDTPTDLVYNTRIISVRTELNALIEEISAVVRLSATDKRLLKIWAMGYTSVAEQADKLKLSQAYIKTRRVAIKYQISKYYNIK